MQVALTHPVLPTVRGALEVHCGSPAVARMGLECLQELAAPEENLVRRQCDTSKSGMTAGHIQVDWERCVVGRACMCGGGVFLPLGEGHLE